MPAQPTNLFLLEDLEDVGRTRELARDDLDALRAVADWVETFVARPHKDLGRPGPVCPFVPAARERKVLWLAAESTGGRTVPDVAQRVDGYKSVLLASQPIDGDDVDHRSAVIVFPDLPAERAKDFFDGVLERLAVPSYADDGLVLGAFYQRNEGSALYNPGFRPFAAPAPFLLMRHAVIGDWKFFLDKPDWLDLWARHYGAAAVRTLAEELRRLPWRGAAA